MSEDFEAEVRRLYEQYKLQWLIYHQLGLLDVIDCMETMIHEDLADGGTRRTLKELFEAWEFGVGFPGGQLWPCFEEYRDCDYSTDSGKAHMLISVHERDINTEVFPTLEAAQIGMLAELKQEFLKDHDEAEWDAITSQDRFESDCFGFDAKSAWSNLDDDCNCDWQIVPIPPVIS